MTSRDLTYGVQWREGLGFGLIAAFIWLDELLDLPHVLMNAAPSPVNVLESLLESGLVTVLGLATLRSTGRLMARIQVLEGLLPICGFCKRIRLDGQWAPIEEYISARAPAQFSHGMCPECAKKHYGDYFDEGEF